MSRQLERLKNLVQEIDQIQKQGQTKGKEHFQKSAEVKSPSQPILANTEESGPQLAQAKSSPSIARTESPSQNQAAASVSTLRAVESPGTVVESWESMVAQSFPQATAPSPSFSATPAQVTMELNWSISVKFKLEDSDEVIEVKRVHDQIELHFIDGKSVRIPLKAA